MYKFTFYFKFIDDGSGTSTIFTWTIRSDNLKEAVKVWTNYIQSGEQLLILTNIKKNNVSIQN